ncbi:AraC family transcriptional regulator [Flagellimonas sp.]|uniref:AraC family transcriptional regulator n=1 Tax=Flagellimonas sp. TaxID=2058762 RepID=UPI003F4A3E76
MKNAIPFKISKSANHALLVQNDAGPHFYDRLHYHEDYQLIAIIKGEGILYAGNGTTPFAEGDVFMIGSNVSHLFKSDTRYFAKNSPGIKGISLFFNYNSFGTDFFNIREMQNLKELLNNSSKGIKVAKKSKKQLYGLITTLPSLEQEKRIIAFLEILSAFDSCEKEYINESLQPRNFTSEQNERLHKILDFSFEHFKEDITIEKIADLAHLSRAQFSHFFKLHTGKTYIQFLNELRIENACVLLKNNQYSVEYICYEVGFRNMSNFLRHFKRQKQTTPVQYRKRWNQG